VAVSKKWYSYFVVTGDAPAAAEAAPAPPAGPPRRVADLVPEAAPDLTAMPTQTPAAADLALVYESAQIGMPAHGYTVLKVAEMLGSDHIRTLSAEVRAKSVLVALDAAGVTVTEIVEDAVRRDRALDTYERVLQQHVDQLAAAIEAENRQIEEEIAARVAELEARIAANTRKVAAEQADFQAWRARKQQEEARIAETVGYFVTDSPITVAPSAATPRGDADVR
jgi:Asp-tRNA(Asn)/Glu-tRNA(Gln) amidotransferase A subunit family amidase